MQLIFRRRPHGALAGMTGGTSGTAIVTNNIFNARLQPVMLSAWPSGQGSFLSLCYDFHSGVAISATANNLPCSFNPYTTGNNGNVFQVLSNVDSTRSATFTYDLLNRITQANTVNTTSSNCWGEAYTIDSWGNLTNIAGAPGIGGSCKTELLNAAPANGNRLNGYCYDAAGNLVWTSGNCPTGSFTPTYTYDEHNRLSTAASWTYYYDADSVRIKKATSATVGTMYWPGPGGEYLTESDPTGVINEEYIYFNGSRVARVDRPSGTVHYYFSDHLGSTGVITDPNGTVQEQYFYYPYGGQVASIGSDPNHYKFTGKERDTESGLDNFGARYYGSSMGRFMTPDWAARPTTVPYAVFGDPQSLNLYSYVRNSTLNRTDPTGHYEMNASHCGYGLKCQKKWDKATQRFEKARQKDLKSKDPNVRAAAAAYGDPGEKNGVHVGFADLKSEGNKGEVHPSNSGKGKLIDVEVKIDIGLKGKSMQETIAHEGSHVGDDIDFLTSYNFGTGKYDPAANFTHGQTEFDAFQTGAGVTKEHGFGPHDDQKILDFLHNSPTYGPIFNVPVFSPNDPNYPQ